MKLAFTPDIALDATVNPDFAQIEADQLVTTANQRFPIFFEEKRPFFLEGSDVFQTPLRAFHSRTIVAPARRRQHAEKRLLADVAADAEHARVDPAAIARVHGSAERVHSSVGATARQCRSDCTAVSGDCTAVSER